MQQCTLISETITSILRLTSGSAQRLGKDRQVISFGSVLSKKLLLDD